MTANLVDLLKRIGLTEYEIKVYLALINKHIDGATILSEESKVPRTKSYSILESLEQRGWVKIYSGYPLLFKAKHPKEILGKIKEDYNKLLQSVSTKMDAEVMSMMEKYVITNYNLGIENLKKELKKAKTVWISNATTDLLKKLKETFRDDAEIKVVLFPNEKKIDNKNIQFKEANLKIVHLVKAKETPAISIVLDEERIFTVFKNPIEKKYVVSEMLYDDCTKCFREWYNLGWDAQK